MTTASATATLAFATATVTAAALVIATATVPVAFVAKVASTGTIVAFREYESWHILALILVSLLPPARNDIAR